MIDWDSLEEQAFQQQLMQQEGGPFDQLSSVFVPGEGSDEPSVFIFGEAPGAQEEVRKRPFVGTAGVALKDLMKIAQLNLFNTWLTNTVKFRPPRNRNPLWHEIRAARSFLYREWKAVGSPKVIIPVGSIALQAATGKQMSILKAAGNVIVRGEEPHSRRYIWPMVHPSFGLRNEAVRPLLEQDWEKLGEWLDDMGLR